MANIEMVPIDPKNMEQVVAALEKYRMQNPKKWEAKKDALLKKYGLAPEEVKEPEPDQDLELAKKKVTKSKTKADGTEKDQAAQ